MTYFLGTGSAMTLIINELLCYLLAKIDSVPTDVLVRLVNENFADGEVDAAKNLLSEYVDDSIKAGPKRGQNKKKHDLDDIVKMLVQCDRSALPRFVALDLAKLPPISVDCIDVSALMRKQQLQDIEIANLKELVQTIMTVTAETSKKIEVGLSSPISSHNCGSASSGPQSACDVKVSPALAGTSTLATSESTHGPASMSRPSYSAVVGDPVPDSDTREWSVANRQKRGRAPVPRTAVAATPSSVPSAQATSVAGNVRPASSKTIIGSKKAGPIKAVAAVKRISMFLSRLPPGTGEEAVTKYVMEQTGADDVTASQLKTRYDSYESYRVDILNPSRDVFDPELWVQGLVVRRFFTNRRSSDDNSTAIGVSHSTPVGINVRK